MYKNEKETYKELKNICSLVMENLDSLEYAHHISLGLIQLSNEEYKGYIKLFNTYIDLGNVILDCWETRKFDDFLGFFTKLDSYTKFLARYADEFTDENRLKLNTFYESLKERYSLL